MVETPVLEIAQWQGSGTPTARRLRRGAADLAALVPAGDHIRVDVSDRPGTATDGVAALDVLSRNLQAVRAAIPDRPAVVLGGDCGVELAPVEAALARHGTGLAVIWFDAHGDLNTPESSPSGAFHGMVLRTLLGDGPSELLPAHTLCPEQLVLAGVRALDPGERAFVDAGAVERIGVADLVDPSPLLSAVEATGAEAVYVHIDVDVLDPEFFASVGTPEPHGITPARLVGAVRALAARFPLAGLGITEYEPARPSDQDVVREIVRALVPQVRSTPPGR
ncbi:arginase [Actinoplanes lobatus]|uniref:Arginase n=1 Tax=Actinoplanes lobatus TaxID=113568 RepID=A0A7W7HMY3_9ACTN|nr:arginase family protein [Actinoplanes lobatus]MBB4753473.1 arginase [Actinoplanes lobatus]GGN91933.1 arginase [Actinoplanes lobatus]GIE38006.1 arginase [Actinoplanes lobatus]